MIRVTTDTTLLEFEELLKARKVVVSRCVTVLSMTDTKVFEFEVELIIKGTLMRFVARGPHVCDAFNDAWDQLRMWRDE